MLCSQRSSTKLGLCLVSTMAAATMAVVESASQLQITVPPSLRKTDGYEHKEALFGMPPLGIAIEQFVYYVDSDMCDPTPAYTTNIYPQANIDDASNGGMLPSRNPFILMMDRGGCTFVQKVRNAQMAGASGVLIADDVCLCTAGHNCVSKKPCEPREPLMADDGSGGDITIPSFLVAKQEADDLKASLMDDVFVRAKMAWPKDNPDHQRVHYQLWMTPSDAFQHSLQRGFRHIAEALRSHAIFEPHVVVHDGNKIGCRNTAYSNQCSDLCTNQGRYCQMDKHEDSQGDISGIDSVTESLRRICIWKEYGKDGVGTPWWDYVEEFVDHCYETLFNDDHCVNSALQKANIDKSLIDACMQHSGGLQDDKVNALIETELNEMENKGIVATPTLKVNNRPFQGQLTTNGVFAAICGSFGRGTEPSVCTHCHGEADVLDCLSPSTKQKKKSKPSTRGKSSSGIIAHTQPDAQWDTQPKTVSMFTMLLCMVGMFTLLSVALAVYKKYHRQQMTAQVRDIMSEYVVLEDRGDVPHGGVH